MAKVWFIGAGPGDPDLITVKGRDLIVRAGAILYTGSLVARAATRWAPAGCDIADSKAMTLDAIAAWLLDRATRHEVVIRLQTGDPALYGTLAEVARPLDEGGVDIGIVPGVSSAFAAAAAAGETLTLPEATQTVIFTRVAGRTPLPKRESLAALARHHCTICLFLSATLLDRVTIDLLAAGWAADAPVLIVYKASWPGEERILRATVRTLEADCAAAAIDGQAMIIVSPALGARNQPVVKTSRLYDATFSHRFRRGAEPRP